MDERDLVKDLEETTVTDMTENEIQDGADVIGSEPDEIRDENDTAEGEQYEAQNSADMNEDELKESVKEEIRAERKENIIEWIKDIAVAAILAAIILTFIKPIVIQQESMLETYLPGDYVIVSRQAYHLFGEPQRGDVIVFKSELEDERGKNKFLIKRIVGLPGDLILICLKNWITKLQRHGCSKCTVLGRK